MSLHTFDAYIPDAIARLLDGQGARKVPLPALQMLTLAILAGFFIAFDAMPYTLVMSGDGGFHFGRNLLPVTLGNVIGGASVALVYWIVYLRVPPESSSTG